MRLIIVLLILSFLKSNCSTNGQASEFDADKKVDQLFKNIKPEEPGYIVGIIKDGRLIYSKGFGIANLDYQIPMSTQSAFYMGSTSKQFTAACLLALVEQGKLSLQDDIRNYLPEIPDYGAEINLYHLLHHTSGIREYTSLMLQAGVDTQWESKFNNDDVYKLICRQKELNFTPGSRYSYSSSGYILLSEIIERVSGKSLRQFADSALFRPLGMKNTYFTDDHQEVITNRVHSYKQDSDGYKRILKSFSVYGDGGLISTLEDLAKWDDAFYSDKLGIVDFGYKMTRVGELKDGHRINYAWALQKHDYHGLPMIEHGGFMINFDSQIMRFPDQLFTVIVLSNCWRNRETSTMNLSYTIADIHLSSSFKEEPSKEPHHSNASVGFNPAEFTGHYWNINENYFNVIEHSDDELFYNNKNGWKPKLIPIEANSFVIEDSDITLHFEDKIMILRNPSANTPDQYFEKYDPTPPKDINKLIKYQGSYYSEELETTYKFMIDEGKLFLRINNNTQRRIFPAIDNVVWNSRNMVWIGFAEIKFVVDSSEEVVGFTIGDNRVRGVSFKKM